MKYVKMLGLAAAAAMALTAFLGASSASATVLCKTATNPCGSDWLYTGSLEASIASGDTVVFKGAGGSFEDTCPTSTIASSVTSQGTNQNVITSVTALLFTMCTKPTAVLETTGTLEFEGTTVKAKGFRITIEAASGINCIFSAGTGTTLGTFNGGNPATISVNGVLNKATGSHFLCPASVTWQGTYTITGAGTLHSEPS